MKIGIKPLFVIYTLVTVPIAIFASNRAGQFKVTTDKGITIVTNGRKPSPLPGAPTKLVLEEIYAAGAGDSPEESFVEAVAVDVGKDGTVYVLDMKDNKVKVFDVRGKISEIKMDRGGLIVARSIGTFGGNGKWLVNVKIYDKDYNLKLTLAAFEVPSPLLGKLNPFSAVALDYALDGQGHLYLGSQSGYEINFVSLEGKLLKIVGRDCDPIPITKGDQDEILKTWSVKVKDTIQFPEVYPRYGNFVLADEGRLLVRTYERGRGTREFYWDVFDAEGRYIAKVPIVHEIRLWRDGKAYSFVENEDGYRVLKCFRARGEK